MATKQQTPKQKIDAVRAKHRANGDKPVTKVKAKRQKKTANGIDDVLDTTVQQDTHPVSTSARGGITDHQAVATRLYCTEITAKGKPCKGRVIAGKTTCIAHADKITKDLLGWKPGANGLQGRKKKPSELEMWQQVYADKHDEIAKVVEDGLKAKKAIVVGGGPSAYVEYVKDHDVRMKVVKEIMDRLIGKPKVTSESHTRNESVTVKLDTKDIGVRTALHDLLRQRPLDQEDHIDGTAVDMPLELETSTDTHIQGDS